MVSSSTTSRLNGSWVLSKASYDIPSISPGFLSQDPSFPFLEEDVSSDLLRNGWKSADWQLLS
jgi:hypothetical protein